MLEDKPCPLPNDSQSAVSTGQMILHSLMGLNVPWLILWTIY